MPHRGSGRLAQPLGAMYARELLRASLSLLALAFASFLVESSQAVISRAWAVLLAVVVLAGWALFFWHFFRSTSMSLRQKAAAWLTVSIVFCMAMLTTHSQYVDGLPWQTQLCWYAFWFGIFFGLVAITHFVAPPLRFPEHNFTVESEAPDHVTTVDGA